MLKYKEGDEFSIKVKVANVDEDSEMFTYKIDTVTFSSFDALWFSECELDQLINPDDKLSIVNKRMIELANEYGKLMLARSQLIDR